MKNKLTWFVLVLAMTAAFSSFAAGDVPPSVIPYSYVSQFGTDRYFLPDDPTLTYSVGVTTGWIFDYVAFRDAYIIYADWEGQYAEAWDHITWANLGWPVTGVSGWYENWVGENYSTGETTEGLPEELEFPWEYVHTSYHYPTNIAGANGTYAEWNTTETTLHLHTGGLAGSSASNFFKLTAYAGDRLAGYAAIPPTSLLVGSAACDTNGAVYGAWADNTEAEVTVHAEQAGYSNFVFGVYPDKARLIISRGGDITGQTNTVIVGEQIALTCKFVDAATNDYNIAPITNFQWTVPGHTISNYIGTTPSVLNTDLNLTNASTYFYWYRPESDLTVQCSIVSKGVTMTAQTTFNVLAPTYTFTGCPLDVVSLDGNYGSVAQWLHFGNADDHGMDFSLDPVSLVQSNFYLDTVHIAVSSEAQRWSNGVRMKFISTNSAYSGNCSFPWSPAESPGEQVYPTELGITREDSFLTYLTYQSAVPNSIPVPLSVVAWSWSGTGINTGSWSLATSPFSFSPTNCLQGTSWPDFPMWKTKWCDDHRLWVPF